jgi:uncharacterized membrane protein YagU involved in acid resistance
MCSLSLSLSIVDDIMAVLYQVYAEKIFRSIEIWDCAVFGIGESDCGELWS